MIAESELLAARILIVDDQPANNRLLEVILREKGYWQITGVTDPRRAVDLYLEKPFDLVLMDYNMPFLNGIQVIEKIKNNKEIFLPVIMITAVQEKQVRFDALANGAQDFITKPFDKLEVIPRIRNMLTIHLLKQNLEQKVMERTRQLEDSRLEMIDRLSRAAEYRDNETGKHVMRIGRFSALVGRALGLDVYTCTLLKNSAPMHDLGKIGIPDHILLKPGRLDENEFRIMMTHAQIGADILAGAREEPLKTAAHVALTHHEKWDGSGYPNGLQGEEIPLAGRVCAVVDVFDALVSARPYKKPWPVEQAFDFLKENRQKHFDSHVVDAFLDCIPELWEIMNQYPDTQ